MMVRPRLPTHPKLGPLATRGGTDSLKGLECHQRKNVRRSAFRDTRSGEMERHRDRDREALPEI